MRGTAALTLGGDVGKVGVERGGGEGGGGGADVRHSLVDICNNYFYHLILAMLGFIVR